MNYKKLSRVEDSLVKVKDALTESESSILEKALSDLGCFKDGKLDEDRALTLVKGFIRKATDHEFSDNDIKDGCGVYIGRGSEVDRVEIKIGGVLSAQIRFMKGGRRSFEWSMARSGVDKDAVKSAIMSADVHDFGQIMTALNSIYSKEDTAEMAYTALIKGWPLRNNLNIDGQDCVKVIVDRTKGTIGYLYSDKKNLILYGNESNGYSADDALKFINTSIPEGSNYLSLGVYDVNNEGGLYVKPSKMLE